MAGQWRPIQDDHAIDMIAFVIQYQSAVPQLLLSRLADIAATTAMNAGLTNSQALSSVSISLQSGSPAAQQTKNPNGILLWSGDSVRFGEQLQIDGTSIIYRVRGYRPWVEQKARYELLLSPLLTKLADVTVPATLRLEYLDRFWFDGKIADADPSLLLSAKSKYLAAHIRSRRDLWHVHTGAFLNTDDKYKNLMQLNVDAVDVLLDENSTKPVRAIHVVSAREDRFSTAETVDTRHAEPKFIFDWADKAHSQLKPYLIDILHEAMADRIGLKK